MLSKFLIHPRQGNSKSSGVNWTLLKFGRSLGSEKMSFTFKSPVGFLGDLSEDLNVIYKTMETDVVKRKTITHT